MDSRRIFPHRVAEDIQLRFRHLKLNYPGGRSSDVKDRALLPRPANTYDVNAVEDRSWTSLRLDVQVTLHERSLRPLLPKQSDPNVDAAMVVSVTCSATKLRRRVVMTPVPSRPGEWDAQIDLDRESVRQGVELEPFLVRATTVPTELVDEDGQRLAAYRGAILATGNALTVLVDQPVIPPVEGQLRVNWENFAKSSHPWRSQHAKDLFYLELNDDAPQVLLNSSLPAFQRTLTSRTQRGPEAVVRKTIMAYIAQTTWTSLVLWSLSAATAASASDDDDAAEYPSDGFKTSVLRRVLPKMYPEEQDERALLTKAVRALKDDSGMPSLLALVNSAVQGLIEVDNLVTKGLEHAAQIEEVAS